LKFKFLALLCYGLSVASAAVAGDFGVSVTLGHDLFEGRAPVADLNLLFGESYGLRVEYMPSLTEALPSTLGSDTKVERSLNGDTVSYGLMKFWDMKHYHPSQGMPLSFLGAYSTLGYSQSEMVLHETMISASQSQLSFTESTRSVRPTSWIFETGFYGGDRFALIDLRLQYRTSSFKPDWEPGKISYASWAMVVSGGVGF